MMPAPRHIAFVSLPAGWSFLYVVVAPMHDYILLPLYRLYRRCCALASTRRKQPSEHPRMGV